MKLLVRCQRAQQCRAPIRNRGPYMMVKNLERLLGEGRNPSAEEKECQRDNKRQPTKPLAADAMFSAMSTCRSVRRTRYKPIPVNPCNHALPAPCSSVVVVRITVCWYFQIIAGCSTLFSIEIQPVRHPMSLAAMFRCIHRVRSGYAIR